MEFGDVDQYQLMVEDFAQRCWEKRQIWPSRLKIRSAISGSSIK